MATIDKIKKERLGKLKTIREAGINPYPARTNRTHSIKQVLDDFDKFSKKKEKIVLCGRIRLLREHGKITFIEIDDGTNKIQGLFRKDGVGEERYKFFLDNFDVGDFVEITGDLIKTKTGEKTIETDGFKMLTKSLRPLPGKWHGLQDEEQKFRKRYLDLIFNPETRELFQKKAIFWGSMREFLQKKRIFRSGNPGFRDYCWGR